MFFKYFLRQTLFSRTFQDSPVYSSTIQACANPVGSNVVHQTTQFMRDYVQSGLTNSVNLAFKQLLNFT